MESGDYSEEKRSEGATQGWSGQCLISWTEHKRATPVIQVLPLHSLEGRGWVSIGSGLPTLASLPCCVRSLTPVPTAWPYVTRPCCTTSWTAQPQQRLRQSPGRRLPFHLRSSCCRGYFCPTAGASENGPPALAQQMIDLPYFFPVSDELVEPVPIF